MKPSVATGVLVCKNYDVFLNDCPALTQPLNLKQAQIRQVRGHFVSAATVQIEIQNNWKLPADLIMRFCKHSSCNYRC